MFDRITYEIYTGDCFPCAERRGNFGEIDLDAAKTLANLVAEDADAECYQIYRKDFGADGGPTRFEVVYSAEYSAEPGYHQVQTSLPTPGDAL